MHHQPFVSVLLLTIVCGTVSAQQPPNAYVAGATAKGIERGTKLSLTERIRRRPDILTNDAVSGLSSELDGRKKTMGETVLMSSDEKTFYLFVHRSDGPARAAPVTRKACPSPRCVMRRACCCHLEFSPPSRRSIRSRSPGSMGSMSMKASSAAHPRLVCSNPWPKTVTGDTGT